MSKYKPLSDYLASRQGDDWTVRFDELEAILGFALPKAARERSSWWENDAEVPKPHARAWLDHGFRAEALDLTGGEVTFRRHRSVGEPPAPLGEGGQRLADPTAHEVMSAAEAVYERDKVAETAKKVGVAAAVLGVLGGVGLVALRLFTRRR